MSALCVRHYALFIFALCVVQVYGTYSIQLCLAPPSLCFRNSFVCTWVCEYHTPRKIKNIGTQKAKRLMFADDIYLLAYTCVVARPYHNSPPVSTWLLTLYEYSSPLAACACCMYPPKGHFYIGTLGADVITAKFSVTASPSWLRVITFTP